jgi:hypothetical protein
MVMTDVLAVVMMMMTRVYLSPTQKYGMADCPYMSSSDVCCDLILMVMTGVYLSSTLKYGMADCPYMSSSDACYCDLILMMTDVLPMVMKEVSFLVNKVLALEMMLMTRVYLSSTLKYGMADCLHRMSNYGIYYDSILMTGVFLSSTLKYGMADCLHRMSNYSQTPSLLVLVAAAAAAAIQVLSP